MYCQLLLLSYNNVAASTVFAASRDSEILINKETTNKTSILVKKHGCKPQLSKDPVFLLGFGRKIMESGMLLLNP